MLRPTEGRTPRPRLLPSTTARRLLAALAVPALLFTAACGSNDGDSKPNAKVEVTGKFGEKPTISVPDDGKVADKLVVKTLIDGTGGEAGKDDFVRLDFAGQIMKDKQSLGGTWEAAEQSGGEGPRRQLVAQLGQPNRELPEKVLTALEGKKVGTRLEVSGTAKSIIGDQLNPEAGLSPADGLVFVIDLVGAQKVEGASGVKGEQAETAEGLPTVKAAEGKAPEVTVPKGAKAPKDLKQQVLIEGDGPKIEAGDGLIAHYTGVKWEDGKKFDSSWDRKAPTAFQIGTGSVVKGWDQALTGKKVGDRVELVIPPELAYGGSPGHELAESTLVFVVDIVGKV